MGGGKNSLPVTPLLPGKELMLLVKALNIRIAESQVDLADALVTEEHVELAVAGRWAQRHGGSPGRLWEAATSVLDKK